MLMHSLIPNISFADIVLAALAISALLVVFFAFLVGACHVLNMIDPNSRSKWSAVKIAQNERYQNDLRALYGQDWQRYYKEEDIERDLTKKPYRTKKPLKKYEWWEEKPRRRSKKSSGWGAKQDGDWF